MTYNVPSISLDDAVLLATTYIKAGIVPCLISAPGIGKTTSAHRIAAALGAQLRPIRLNNIPPEEVTGLQYIDREGSRSTYLPPKWMPNPDGTDGPVLVFIDEITQAPDENRKAIMSALIERYLGDTRIPDNCYFMVAGNSVNDGTNVYEFDRATADRFGVILVKTDVEKWCNDYAPQKEIDLSIVTFLRLRPDLFEMSEMLAESDNVVGASPRSWEAIDQFIKQSRKDGLREDLINAGIMGKAGQEVGTAYASVREQVGQLKSVADLADMTPLERRKHRPTTLAALWTYCQGMIWYGTDEKKCQTVFEILESFQDIEDVPFFEVRFTVAELLLTRAVDLHGVKTIFENVEMQRLLEKWTVEMDNVVKPADVGAAANEGEAVRYAA